MVLLCMVLIGVGHFLQKKENFEMNKSEAGSVANAVGEESSLKIEAVDNTRPPTHPLTHPPDAPSALSGGTQPNIIFTTLYFNIN